MSSNELDDIGDIGDNHVNFSDYDQVSYLGIQERDGSLDTEFEQVKDGLSNTNFSPFSEWESESWGW